MPGGYVGKVLWVDLTYRTFRVEVLPEDLLYKYIGGYGVAAKILFDRQEPGIEPFDSEAILGITTGPLTGVPAAGATRWTAIGKSPLTGTWGDANGSGNFGPILKAACFDAVYFTGISEHPVYLLIQDGTFELKDARHIWGKDTYEVEDYVKKTYGHAAEAICIGQAGENLSRISGIVTAKGRIAARSGLGALMGSKKLKAVIAKGSQQIPLAFPEKVKQLRTKYIQQIKSGYGYSSVYRNQGTPGSIYPLAIAGDAPTKNWKGVGSIDFDPSPFLFDEIEKYKTRKKGCWQCPIACWGEMKIDYQESTIEAQLPEYESATALGTNCLVNDLAMVERANDLCNRFGLDTISAGSTVAFAMECFEGGLINKSDTDGLELNFGNGIALVVMIEKMAYREGIGKLFCDGVKVAAENLGAEAEQFAQHLGGQELPMHDPRYEPGIGLIYRIDATPGRHTQAFDWFATPGFEIGLYPYGEKRHDQAGRGKLARPLLNFSHAMQTSGICMFTIFCTHVDFLPEFMAAVTGKEYAFDTLLETGERIATIRHLFNLREGVNPILMPVPKRAYGYPPLNKGPTAGSSVDIDLLTKEYLEVMDWDVKTTIPSRRRLKELDLEEYEALFYPEN